MTCNTISNDAEGLRVQARTPYKRENPVLSVQDTKPDQECMEMKASRRDLHRCPYPAQQCRGKNLQSFGLEKHATKLHWRPD